MIIACKVSLVPFDKVIFDLFNEIDSILLVTFYFTTCFFPFCDLTVIVAVPPPTAVTLPVLSTVAIFGLLLVHFNVLSSVVSLGLIVAFKVSLVPFDKVIFDLFNEIDSILLVTFTSQLASFPFCDLTVIVAVPPPTAVTLPVLSTVATSGLLLVHFNVLSSVVSLGLIICLRFHLCLLLVLYRFY